MVTETRHSYRVFNHHSYQSFSGYVSFRREDIGSWYVQAIVDVFSQHAHEKDINSLLTMVNRKVSKSVVLTNCRMKSVTDVTLPLDIMKG